MTGDELLVALAVILSACALAVAGRDAIRENRRLNRRLQRLGDESCEFMKHGPQPEKKD